MGRTTRSFLQWLIALCAAVCLLGTGFPGTALAKSHASAGAHGKHKKVKAAAAPAGDTQAVDDGSAAVAKTAGVVVGAVWLVFMALSILSLVAMWKLFTIAGKPGWASIVPIYNLVQMIEIAGKPTWQILLYLVPFVNIYASISTHVRFVKAYGKGTGFAVASIFLPFVFFPLLAFGGTAVYQRPGAPTPQGGAPIPNGSHGASGIRKAA
jgi:Family of unknown function (DUF5684)